MQYDSIDEWLDVNTQDAYEIAENLSNEDDREELTCTLDFLRYEIMNRDKQLRWLNDAIDAVVDEDIKAKIMEMFMIYMHNDFITNTEFGREMLEKGFMKPAGFGALWEVGDDSE